jgi:hypothetical protein
MSPANHAFCFDKHREEQRFLYNVRPKEPGARERKNDMALTRKMLKAMGIEEEKIDQIIEAHTETVDGLKADVQKYKGDAEKLPTVQKELDDLKAASNDGWEAKAKEWERKYTDLVAENQNRETHAAKENAYRELLRAAGVSEKRLNSVLRLCDVDSVELVNGKIKGAEELSKSIKSEWSDFIVTTETTGVQTENPPANTGGRAAFEAMSLTDKMRYANEHPTEAAEWLKG